MQLDRKAINKMLNLDDEQLKSVIRSLAQNAGLDLSGFNISENDVAGIRRALSGASDADIAKASEQLSKHRRGE